MALFLFSGVIFLSYLIYQYLRRLLSSGDHHLSDGDPVDDGQCLRRFLPSGEQHLRDGDQADEAQCHRRSLSLGEHHLSDGDRAGDAQCLRRFLSSGEHHLLDGDPTDGACESPMSAIPSGQGELLENMIDGSTESDYLTVSEITELLRGYKIKYTSKKRLEKRKQHLYLSAFNSARRQKGLTKKKIPTVGSLPTIGEFSTLDLIFETAVEKDSVSTKKTKKRFSKIRRFFKKFSCIRKNKD